MANPTDNTIARILERSLIKEIPLPVEGGVTYVKVSDLLSTAQQTEELREALNLARNRLRAAAINAAHGSRESYEYSEWADEADAALAHSVEIKPDA